jgi:hypothetical protein
MARGRVSRGRWLVGIGVGLGVIAAPLPRALPNAGAVLVCQNKRKAKLVAFRADKCTKKENVAIDLSNVLAMQTSASADQGTRLGIVQPDFGATCPGSPSLTLAASNFSPRGVTRTVARERPGGGCRTLDGNQAACLKTFQTNDPFANRREFPASSCFFFKGFCLPCTDNVAKRAECTNACIAKTTCADPTRTVFLGGFGGDACKDPKTQVDCEKSWHIGRLDVVHRAASCYWTGTACRGCGPSHANQLDCTNTCDTTPHPTCKDAARTMFLGGPNASTAKKCKKFNGNQAMCEVSYHVTGEGTAATCWYETTANQCLGCGLRWETVGKCNNTCL